MVSCYIVIFYQVKLYSDMLLQVVYIFLQIYGWWAWLHSGPHRSNLQVTRLRNSHASIWLCIAMIGTATVGMSMSQYTDASFPYLDAFTTVASLIAQWLMGRKKLESWLIWIVVDVVSIGLYCAKGLYLTGGLYTLFLLLAATGYITWKRSILVKASA